MSGDVDFSEWVVLYPLIGLFADKTSLAKLLASLRCTATPMHASRKPPNTTRKLLAWLSATKDRSQAGTGRILFRLLFPETDIKRRYGLKEHTLTPLLSSILGVDFKSTSHCLGQDVYNALTKCPSTSTSRTRNISLHRVDELLTELAARCIWSSECVKKKRSRRTKEDILRDLLCGIPAESVAFLTQIILKDITPLLYPPPSTKSLNDYNTNAYTKLKLHDAMGAWHWSMPKIYAKMVDLDTAADTVDDLPADATPFECIDLMKSCPGYQLEIPKCVKGLSLRHALDVNQGAQQLMAETKYDGERMQIHIIDCDNIKIFSKSKRDSTNDRVLTIPIIREALGLPPKVYPRGFPADEFNHALSSSKSISTVQSAILEAEMVAYDRRKNTIDEFCRIRGLLQSGRANYDLTNFGGVNPDSSIESIDEDVDHSSKGHLAVVFFDVLYLDGRDLTNEPLCRRRNLLEKIVRKVPQFSMLSHIDRIDIRDFNKGMSSLQRIYASNIANCEEGLVLKPSYGTHNSPRWRWIKVKRDYIPGLGDTAEFVVIGARHDQQRGRELLVPPQVLTTFTIGLQAKQSDMRKLRHKSRICHGDIRDHFHGLFDVSYGLTRSELEQLNFEAKWRAGEITSLPYTCSFEKGLTRPTLLFHSPILFEIVGASFTRKPWSKWYEIRFPRITKVYNESDRPWNSGLSLRDLQSLAIDSVDAERQDAHDEIQRMFEGSTVSRSDRWLGVLQRSEKELSWGKCKSWLDPAINKHELGPLPPHKLIVDDSSEDELEADKEQDKIQRPEPALSSRQSSQICPVTPTSSFESCTVSTVPSHESSQVLGKRGRNDADASTEEEDETLKPMKHPKLSIVEESDDQTDEEMVVVPNEVVNPPQTANLATSIPTPITPTRITVLETFSMPHKQQKAIPPLDRCLVFTDTQSTCESLDVSGITLAEGGLNRLMDYVGWKMRPLEVCDGRVAVVTLSTTQFGLVAALKSRRSYLDKEYKSMKLGRVVVVVEDSKSVVPLAGFRLLWDSNSLI